MNAWQKDTRGNMAATFALLIAGIMVLVGGAVDYAGIVSQKKGAQAVADGAALAAARELSLSGTHDHKIKAVAQAYVESKLDRKTVQVVTQVDRKQGRVDVSLEVAATTYFPLPLSDVENFKVSAAATQSGQQQNICVIGLDPASTNTVYLDSNATLTANRCSVYSNSASRKGLVSDSNAKLVASSIFTSGGYDGGTRNFSPRPVTDTPAIQDPLAGRAKPAAGLCDYNNFEIKDVTATLKPGTYCGGLYIDGNANITLGSGTYIMKDGPFIVDSNSVVDGENVGFFLTGNDARFEFTSNASVNMTAPKTGIMAGLLFFEDPLNRAGVEHTITSNYTRNMVGTIYLPRGKFRVDADTEVADQSEYTVIVAWQIELNSGPNLVLNVDYDQTDIPVPEGVGPVGNSDLRLLR